ncbi:MAG: TraR/DksA C4-type zinc finger protein [Proteobacteria bacterium]|nr:TraR/DksA C4-type zinc finger protein [Pseudomonadota bacterium]
MKTNELIHEDFKRCVDFHGHICGGLAIGYRAAQEGLLWLKEHRALDEELVTIVENDACGVDAVQVLTGCTFGKGNFIYRDYGKMAFTFFSRKTGKGVRMAPVDRGFAPDPEQKALFEKVRSNTATDEDRKTLSELGRKKAEAILESPLEKLFKITPAQVPIPEKARIHPSILCDRCHEPTMETRLENIDGQKICRGCQEQGAQHLNN